MKTKRSIGEDSRICPVCIHQDVKFISLLYDDRYGLPGQSPLMQCSRCGHAFLDCHLSSSQLSDIYANYYPRRPFNIAQWNPHTERGGFIAWLNGLGCSAFRWVPRNVRVLDVGCGFGESLGYHVARGCDVYGVEADQNIRRVVDKYGFKVHVGLFDDNVYEQSFFDFVTMDQVIEHVEDPIATLRGVARILKPGGVAILSTPNAHGWGARLFGNRWINWHSPYHLHCFTRNSMQLAAEQAGLVLEKVQTITNSDWLLYQWIHLVTYPSPGKPSWFWSPNKSGAAFHEKWVVNALSLLHKTKINHCVTRLFDGIDLGDNCVYWLRRP
jgi:2-polyprenyl-3-methyl-5-hydroxy-6-metoxy-1,4-benzoquinol methylase